MTMLESRPIAPSLRPLPATDDWAGGAGGAVVAMVGPSSQILGNGLGTAFIAGNGAVDKGFRRVRLRERWFQCERGARANPGARCRRGRHGSGGDRAAA